MVLPFQPRERGSIVALIVVSIAGLTLVGVISFRAFGLMIQGGDLLGRRAQAQSLVLQAAQNIAAESLDGDADGVVESATMHSSAGGPPGGGTIPLTSAAPKVDAWGTRLGYCSWDNGPGGKNTSAGRIAGDTDTVPAAFLSMNSVVFAVISAGANRAYDTTCMVARTGVAGDDTVTRFTIAEIMNGNGGSLFFGAPTSSAAKQALDGRALNDGEIRLEADTNQLSRWDSASGSWVALGGSGSTSSGTDGVKNALINGNFEIWQRGPAGSCAFGPCYAADRWLINGSATDSGAASTQIPGASFTTFAQYSWAQAPVGSGAGPTLPATALGVTRISRSSDPAGDMEIITQRIEGAETLAGKNVTASFWIKTNGLSKRFCFDLYQYYGAASSPRGVSNGRTCYVADSNWKKMSFTVPLPAMNLGVLTEENALWFRAVMEPKSAESSRHDSFTVYIAQAQVEDGGVATVFNRRHPAVEWDMAQRFYETGILTSFPRGFNQDQCCTKPHFNFATVYYKASKRIATTPSLSSISVDPYCMPGPTSAEAVTSEGFRALRYGIAEWYGTRCNFADRWVVDAEFWH